MMGTRGCNSHYIVRYLVASKAGQQCLNIRAACGRNSKWPLVLQRCAPVSTLSRSNEKQNETDDSRDSENKDAEPKKLQSTDNTDAVSVSYAKEAEPKKPVVSYLGLGFDKVRYWRHVLKKQHLAAQNKKKEDEEAVKADDVPASIKLWWDHLPSDIKNQYPQVERCLKASQGKTPDKNQENEKPKPIQYPFRLVKPVSTIAEQSTEPKPENETNTKSTRHRLTSVGKLWQANDGVADPSSEISNVPCGGCGALLQCINKSLPGFMPSEKYKSLSEDELRTEQCQRCLYLRHFNVALNVSVDPSEYPKILGEIKKKEAIVLLMVDLTDFPCSIWPGITDLIGDKTLLIVAGNKADLLPRDCEGYLKRVKQSLTNTLMEMGIDNGRNIKHIELISAKTGYGIEKLISALYNFQMGKDVYLVGCTNVGKSTLFNALLRSDFCKVRAVDLVQRATASPWPGTTLNLLKFPILRPTGWRIFLRTKRIGEEKKLEQEEEEMRRLRYRYDRRPEHATLIGRIGMTFYHETKINEALGLTKKYKPVKGTKKDVFDPDDPEFAKGHFCYDTPGAVYKDQILDLLTAEEIMKIIPKQIITPRTFSLRPHQTLFVAGLGRIDLTEASRFVLVTVFASEELPIHIVDTKDAEEFYTTNLGSELLMVPFGGSARLKDFPPLKPKEFTIKGLDYQESSADIVLSSAGWVAFALQNGQQCTVKAYTPDGRGCHFRSSPVSAFSVRLKGGKIRGTPAYENKKFAIVY